MKRKRLNSRQRRRGEAMICYLDATPEERLDMSKYHIRKFKEYIDKHPEMLQDTSPSWKARNQKQKTEPKQK